MRRRIFQGVVQFARGFRVNRGEGVARRHFHAKADVHWSVLAGKLFIFARMLVLAAANRVHLAPASPAPVTFPTTSGAVGRLKRDLVMETLLALALLVVVVVAVMAPWLRSRPSPRRSRHGGWRATPLPGDLRRDPAPSRHPPGAGGASAPI